LVRSSIEKAKTAGLPIVVSAEPAAHVFFQHRGFRDVKHAVIDLRKWAPEYTGFGEFRLTRMVLD
jgi:hypothetical protein